MKQFFSGFWVVLISISGILFLGTSLANAVDLDPGYLKAFGYKSIVASGKGYPAFEKYDPSQIDYQDKKFHIDAGENATLDLRAIWPKGKPIKFHVKKLIKDQAANYKNVTVAPYVIWQFWAAEEGKSFPTNLKNTPDWEPIAEQLFEINKETGEWLSSGCPWENLKEKGRIASWLANAKSGDMIYAIYTVGFTYKEKDSVENKFDTDLNKFVPTNVTGAIGYALADPIAACIIVIN